MKKTYPKLIVLVVYKSQASKNWRGFCSPYDVSCEAKTAAEAKSKLTKLIKLYEEGLKKYGYPEHLTILPLSEKQDKVVLEKVMEKITLNIKKDFLKFQTAEETQIRTRNLSINANVLQPCLT
ncbi:MAG: hypothetical protein Q8M92_03360 [Candidatus Subteraquimicrobiales bacterium]|nr:hypothetical protein [Candidatus Subteraquimicrobiales bacterium]